MPTDRKTLIAEIEAKRDSRVLTYVNGDQQPFITQIAEDAVRVFRRHLDEIGSVERLDLFLYSRGGDMLTPLRLVRLIREHCKKFSVLVPYRAHSAATSIALGADEIVMGKLAELSPVDPSTDHPFNPQNPVTPQQRLQISVEDIASFFALAKERASIQSEQMIEVFRQLAAQVHPLALGNADRTYRMARALTGKLLALHLDPEKEKAKIDAIIAKLTQDLSIHGYPISRREARDEIGLKVLIPDEDLESAMWDLMESYEDHLKLLETFDPASLAKPGPPAIIERPAACIESISRLDEFAFKVAVGQVASPGGQPMFNVNIQPGVWVKR